MSPGSLKHEWLEPRPTHSLTGRRLRKCAHCHITFRRAIEHARCSWLYQEHFSENFDSEIKRESMVNIDEKTQTLITDAIKITDGVNVTAAEVEFKFNLSSVDAVPLGKIVLDLKLKRFEFVWPGTTPAGNRGILAQRYADIAGFEDRVRRAGFTEGWRKNRFQDPEE